MFTLIGASTAEGDFRNNISQGGTVSFEDIPAAALDFAVEVARRCGFDEVGLDICEHAGKYWVLEANMVFGQEGFRKKGLDIHKIIARPFRFWGMNSDERNNMLKNDLVRLRRILDAAR